MAIDKFISRKVFLQENNEVPGAYINKRRRFLPSFSVKKDEFNLTQYIKDIVATVLTGASATFVSITAVTANIGKNLFGFGTASAPSISFNSDDDTGIYRSAANTIGFTAGGTQRATISSSGVTAEIFKIGASGQTSLVVDGTNAQFQVNGGSMLNITSTGIRNTHQIETGITAFAGGGQASATVINKEYNFVSTVANNADSVKLTDQGQFWTRYVIKNESSNSLAIFPPVGGNLGAGLNTSISLSAGSTAEFISINSTTVFKRVL